MFELVYCSVAHPELKPEDIESILVTARDFNSANNITGCLVYHNKEFVQVLEGEKRIVLELYGRIVEDKRHSNVFLLGKEEKDERSFANWNMAYHSMDDQDMKKSDFTRNMVSLSELSEKPTPVIEVFWAMVRDIIESDLG